MTPKITTATKERNRRKLIRATVTRAHVDDGRVDGPTTPIVSMWASTAQLKTSAAVAVHGMGLDRNG
jgi:hypothetical protein